MTLTKLSYLRRLAVLLLVLSVYGGGDTAYSGNSTQSLYQINTGYGDMFHNYDYTQDQGFGWNTVDWGVSLMFFNNAEINKVKDTILGNNGYWVGATYNTAMWAYVDDDPVLGGEIDEDQGKKTGIPACVNSTRHFRAYAPPSTDRFYNPDFGYYIIATTHLDHNEKCDGFFDDSEGTEENIAYKMQDLEYEVWHDFTSFYNYQYEVQGNHHFEQNGYATYVRVTGPE